MQGRVKVLTTFRTGDDVIDRNLDHIKQTLNPVLGNPLLAAVDFRWAEIQGADSSKAPTFALQYRSTGTTWTTILTVDSTGQIAQPAWIAPTLLNGFTNFGSGFISAGYMKDAQGFVHLRGLVQNVGGVGAATVMFSLPSGYRPSGTARYSTGGEGTPALMTILDVKANGDVTPVLAVAAGGYRSLDGITFDTR